MRLSKIKNERHSSKKEYKGAYLFDYKPKNYIIINGALAALLIFEIFLWRFIMKK